MPLIWPFSLRTRVAWAYAVLIIGASWFTMWRWRSSSDISYGFESSTTELDKTVSNTGNTPQELTAWFPLHESADASGSQRVSAHNARSLRNLLRCMQAGTCRKNQRKVVILEDGYLVDTLRGYSWVGGEMIWANSTIKALETLGYTYLFVTQWEQAVFQHSLFPDLVTAVIMNPDTLTACWREKFYCVKSPQNPDGLPIWKLLAFFWWGHNVSPLDARWVLSPEPWPAFESGFPSAYVGYSIEERCTSHAFIPVKSRSRRAYILGKHLHYFVPNVYDGDPAWPTDVWETAANELGVTFVAGIKNDAMPDGSDVPGSLPLGIERLPELGPDEFVDELAKSRVLIGIGHPRTSPTPYEALCMGVPFINPITSWDENDPEDSTRWSCQHDPLCFYGPGPPYIYNVKRGDRHAFLEALKAAIDHPIDRYIPETTRQDAVAERLDAIFQQDRLRMARDILRQRQGGSQQGEVFSL